MRLHFIAVTVVLLQAVGCADMLPDARPAGLDDAPRGAIVVEEFAELAELAELAEFERRGRYVPGMGLYESSIRQRSGDSLGAVFAAYKDIAYAYGRGELGLQDVRSRLDLLEAKSTESGSDGTVQAAIKAIRSCLSGDWQAAVPQLAGLGPGTGQQDSFQAWVVLAARLESGTVTAAELERYSMMQARYALLPEYWYRFYRAQTNVGIRRDSAERCVALAPGGPYSSESRTAIALSYGLERDDGAAILIPAEIEALAALAVRSGEPKRLEALLPVLGLPDNPLTLYAVGTLRGLCSVDVFRIWSVAMASESAGRRAERLRYVSRR